MMRELATGALRLFAAGLWQGPAVVFLVLLLFRGVPRLGAATRAAVWVCAFALLAATPLLHAGSRAATAGAAASAPLPGFHLPPLWGYALLGLWAVLAGARALRLTAQAVRLRGIWRRAVPLPADAGTVRLLQAGPRRAKLCASAEVDAPMVIGFVAPRLLLPADLVGRMEAQDLQHIALHEMEHLRRRDDWVNLAQKLLLVLFPLHPGLVWVDRRLSRERELACDAGVVARTASPLRYAACLARLAEHRLRGRMTALALAAWTRRPELLRRVETLLSPAQGLTQRQARVALGLLVGVLGAGAVEMAQAPPLVSLTAPAGSHLTGPTPAATAVNFAKAAAPSRAGAVAVVYRQGQSRTGLASGRSGPVAQQALYVMHDGGQNAPASLAKATLERKAFGSGRPVSAAPAAAGRRGNRSAGQDEAHGSAGKHVLPGYAPHMLLTSASAHRRPAAPHFVPAAGTAPVYTLTIQRAPAYAAVPFGDGWLIVQL